MALSIKTAEADALARALIQLTGETMTQAVTVALRERLERERSAAAKDSGMPARVTALVERMRPHYDTRPVSQEEWDAACGKEF